MNKSKKYILIPVLSLLCINNVYASCTQEEINNFKKIEDEYTVTYGFDTETKTYTLYLKNPEPEKYGYVLVQHQSANTTIETGLYVIKEKEFGYPNISPGDYEIKIIGTTDTCSDTLKKTSLSLAKYNKYSEDSLCEGIEEFVLCQPTYDKEIDYETFKSRVETYKKTKVENNTTEEETNNNQIFDKVSNYIKENILKIIIIVIFIILVITSTILTIKSIKKSRRLE